MTKVYLAIEVQGDYRPEKYKTGCDYEGEYADGEVFILGAYSTLEKAKEVCEESAADYEHAYYIQIETIDE